MRYIFCVTLKECIINREPQMAESANSAFQINTSKLSSSSVRPPAVELDLRQLWNAADYLCKRTTCDVLDLV